MICAGAENVRCHAGHDQLHTALGKNSSRKKSSFREKQRPRECSAEQDDPFPRPAGNAVPDTPRDTVGPFGSQGTLLAHAHLAADQDPKSLSAGLLPSLSFPSLNIQPGLPHPRCRIQRLLLVNFIPVGNCPAL